MQILDVSYLFNYLTSIANIGTSFVMMADLVQANYISATSTDSVTMESIIPYNFSRGMDPVYLEVKQGVFTQHTQISSAPTISSSSTNPSSLYQVNYSPNVASSSMSSAQSILRDEDYVTVTLVGSGDRIANNVYRFQTTAGMVEKRGAEFYEGIHPTGASCMVYYGVNSARYYWTWTLDPEQVEHREHRGHRGHRGHGRHGHRRR